MINKREVLQRARRGEMLEIRLKNDNVFLRGTAFVDTVTGGGGIDKVRAKFTNGVKAILDLAEYKDIWKAYNVKTGAQLAGGGLPAASAGGGSRQGDTGRGYSSAL